MSRSIRSYPKAEQRSVINRRLEKPTYGLGYWAAIDAERRLLHIKTPKKQDNSSNK